MPSKPKTVKSHCNVCARETNQRVVRSYGETDSDPKDNVWLETVWQIVKCGGCDAVSFRTISVFSEDRDEDGTYYPTIKCIPPAEKDILPTKPLVNAPRSVRRVYGEVIDTFNRGSLLLCAGGVRAIVESICKSEGIVDGPVIVPAKGGGTREERRHDLRGRIAGMAEKGLITPSHRDILHEHRFLGNEALHEMDIPHANELKLAIEILEHTLDHVYEIPIKAAELKKLKARRRGGIKLRRPPSS